MTTSIEYLVGDATRPVGSGSKIIAHICNDAGAWGAGFVIAISQRWLEPAAAYKSWHAERAFNDFNLGAVQLVNVEEDLFIANMIGQNNYGRNLRVPPIRYEAVDTALETLGDIAIDIEASVHMPRIGCGLAGGQWDIIEPLIVKNLSSREIPVSVYDLA
jgi:O-acetyl-ADP-ribose deacetylase (regulator of RNase III)